MLERNNSVCFLGAWLDACSLWRFYYPHQNIPGSSFYFFANQPNFDVIAGCDVLVVQRCCSLPQFNFINTCRALGSRIIYDPDDDVWDLPEYNPAHKPLQRWLVRDQGADDGRKIAPLDGSPSSVCRARSESRALDVPRCIHS